MVDFEFQQVVWHASKFGEFFDGPKQDAFDLDIDFGDTLVLTVMMESKNLYGDGKAHAFVNARLLGAFASVTEEVTAVSPVDCWNQLCLAELGRSTVGKVLGLEVMLKPPLALKEGWEAEYNEGVINLRNGKNKPATVRITSQGTKYWVFPEYMWYETMEEAHAYLEAHKRTPWQLRPPE